MTTTRPPAAWLRAAQAVGTLLVGLGGAWQPRSMAGDASSRVDFQRDVRPVLSDACFRCHGPDRQARKADLRLDLREGGAFDDRGGYRVIVPGRPDESELYRRITAPEPGQRMPPAKHPRRLRPGEIALLRRWIEQGAPWQVHWSFVPPRRPALPRVKDPSWPRNAIDSFILARLEKEGLRPAPEADRATLIRRVTLDLTGLPPSPHEVDAFLADPAPDAYERVVDRLLASPRYGERMAVDWLDAARYADTNGYQVDRDRDMWPWRDWVVNAFNRNLPFDQFTVEQLAGDLLPNPTREQRIATGLQRNHMLNEEGGVLPEEFLAEYLADRVETTATVWLGLTLGCTRCHDHKFDPFSQKDFYRLYAFFHNVPESGLGNFFGSYKKSAPPLLTLPTPEQQRQLDRLAAAVQKVEKQLAAAGPALDAEQAAWEKARVAAPPLRWVVLDPSAFQSAPAGHQSGKSRLSVTNARSPLDPLPPAVAQILSTSPPKRTDQQKKGLQKYYREHVSPTARQFANELARLRKQHAEVEAQVPAMMVMAEMPKPRDTFVLIRGQYDKKGEKVDPGTPASLPPLPPSWPRNRLGLARWLVDPANPLTARVLVNRYWQSYFGVGLVRTAEDFGSQGEAPSHLELLDFLATELVRQGWDVKRMQRRIVTSATYRQSSRVAPHQRERDPENRLLARGPRFRLPAEMIRDQALAVSGLLVEKRGGPPVKPYHPSGLYEQVVYQGGALYQQGKGPDLHRRSLYTYWKRSVPHPAMLTFDAPFRETCTVRRARTATPLQALNLMNDPTYVEAARFLAQRMMRAAGTRPEERIAYGFRLTLARAPRADELAVLAAGWRRMLADFRKDLAAAGQLLRVGDTPADPALDRAELAAYTTVASTLLNLDETITKD